MSRDTDARLLECNVRKRLADLRIVKVSALACASVVMLKTPDIPIFGFKQANLNMAVRNDYYEIFALWHFPVTAETFNSAQDDRSVHRSERH